jgi:hypothetical protein
LLERTRYLYVERARSPETSLKAILEKRTDVFLVRRKRDERSYEPDAEHDGLRASNDDKFRRAIKKLNVLNFFRGPAAQILPAPETPKEDGSNGSFGGTGFAGPLPSRRGSVHPGQLRRAP